MSFEYDIDGLRTKKTVQNGESYTYHYMGTTLCSVEWSNGTKSLNFLYENGSPYSVVYNNGTDSVSYYYVTNLQGDVIALLSEGESVVEL